MKTKRLWFTKIAFLLLLVAFMSNCKDEDVEVITECPLVVSTNPANLAENVPLNQVIVATFNVAMNPATFTEASFTIQEEALLLKTTPTTQLRRGEVLPPTNTKGEAKTSSELGNVSTSKTQSDANAAPIAGTITYSGLSASFTPAQDLNPDRVYTATISWTVKDLNGNNLETDYVWTFSTGMDVLPMVALTNPLHLATNVPLNQVIVATFNVAMNPETFTEATFTVQEETLLLKSRLNTQSRKGEALHSNNTKDNARGAVGTSKIQSNAKAVAPIVGTVAYAGLSATFTPTLDLTPNRIYTATISWTVEDLEGNNLAADYVWTFSTAASDAPTVISTDPLNLATNVPLDKVISANFNMAMNPTTINTSTFTLMDDVTPIAGVVGYTGTTATFTPSSNLTLGKTYTATITTGAMNTEGTALAEDYVWTFSTGAAIAPTVLSVDPFNGAINVALDKVISANFSMAMDPLTINTSTFILMDGATPIAGTVDYLITVARNIPSKNASAVNTRNSRNTASRNSYGGKSFTATFTPISNLDPGTTYTATITTGAESAEGIALEDNFVWTFSTGAALAPTVLSVDPLDGAIDVPLDKMLSAIFSEEMDPLTITTSTFTLMDGATPIGGAVNYSGTAATFTPTINLDLNTTYTATITTGAQNLAGTPLADNYVWTFTTSPLFTLTVIAVNGTVEVNPDQVGYNFGDIVELTAIADPGYSFDSWSGDAIGTDNPLLVTMDEDKTITAIFTENPPLGPGIVDLGTAGDFAILAKSGISTINSTLITGHIGISPVTSTAFTGFSQTLDASGEFATSIYVVGNMYAADYAPPTPTYISTAISDQETAFTTAMGLVTDVITDLGAGDISGMTLAPGLYKWGTGLLITNQGVTLEGGPNDTWVFQIADDFTIQNDASIVLAGGAQYKNIFWITSTQALLGSNVEFYGNILAQTLISLTSNTTVYGRLLSQTAVTLDGSIVTKPTGKK